MSKFINVTLKQVQAFVAVARTGSFAEAATTVNLSQPALSIAVRKLEEALGGSLFARSTRSVLLTPEGEAFFPEARRLLADWERSIEDIGNLFALRRGRLNIASMPSFAGSLLPDLLAQCHQLHPDINITIHDVVAETVVEMVQQGQAELGLSFCPSDRPDLEFRPLFTDRFVVALPPGHTLIERGQLRWKDLAESPMIALQRPSALRIMFEDALNELGAEFKPVFEAHQLAHIGRMVATGLGVSVVPSLCVQQMNEMGVVCLPLLSPAIEREVGVLWRRRRPLSVAAASFLEQASNWSGFP